MLLFPLPEDPSVFLDSLSNMVVDDITTYFVVVIEVLTVALPSKTDEFMVVAFKLDVRAPSIPVEFRVVDTLEVFAVVEMVAF